MQAGEDQRRRWGTPPELWDQLKPIAKEMRRAPTAAENALWRALRRDALSGLRFRRQHAIGQFIVDFYCSKSTLVIEVDGPVHQGNEEQDAARQQLLEARGLLVLRFTNEQVLEDLSSVLHAILGALAGRR
jgi:very-short-patch-repair endonuclease